MKNEVSGCSECQESCEALPPVFLVENWDTELVWLVNYRKSKKNKINLILEASQHGFMSKKLM